MSLTDIQLPFPFILIRLSTGKTRFYESLFCPPLTPQYRCPILLPPICTGTSFGPHSSVQAPCLEPHLVLTPQYRCLVWNPTWTPLLSTGRPVSSIIWTLFFSRSGPHFSLHGPHLDPTGREGAPFGPQSSVQTPRLNPTPWYGAPCAES